MRWFSKTRRGVVGIAFCGNQLALVGLSQNRQEILFVEYMTLTEPIYFLPNGNLSYIEKIMDILKDWVFSRKCQGWFAAVGLPHVYTMRKNIELFSGFNMAERETFLQENFSEYFPGVEANLVFDFCLLPSTEKQDDILLVATRQTTVDQLSLLIKNVDLQLRVIDLDIYAKSRILQKMHTASRIKILLDYASSEIQMIILDDNKFVFFENEIFDSYEQLEKIILTRIKKHLGEMDLSSIQFYLSFSCQFCENVLAEINHILKQKINLLNSFGGAFVHSAALIAFGLAARKFPKW